MYIPDEPGRRRAQTYEPGNTDIGPQMAKIKASGAEVVAVVHDPRLHRARAAGRRQARLPPAVRREQRRLGPDDADRPAEGVLEGQGRRVADRGHRHRRLPAAARRHVRTAGSRCSRRSTTSTSRSCRCDGNVAVRACRWRTRSPRRSRRPGENPTRQGIVDAIEKGGLKGPGLVPFRYSERLARRLHRRPHRPRSRAASSCPRASRWSPTTARARSTPYTEAQPEAPANGIPPAA